ncbi:hypothetical protein SLEP1_g41533 [Rubroshorea leprosula]|uniref:Metal tolerance protein B n=1 Tax=Rubroshorea leprosula TaxID=152421 RepID=A0AAV5L798_9ROSI|nr:hypothetical protein SLEP1_g41533 [Rubroshorea leprosula]
MEREEVSVLRSEDKEDIEMATVPDGNNAIATPNKLFSCSSCVFSNQENCNLESKQRSKSAAKLCGLISFYVIVMVVEVVGGVKANSLAVITDAAHLLTDVAGFSISLFTVWASAWEATSNQSFGYGRLEVLGALLSVQLIWLISALLIYEALDRMLHKNATVNGTLMFAIAAFGFFINLVMVMWLGHDHTHHGCGDKDYGHVEGGHLCTTTEDEEASLVSSSKVETKVMNINLQGAYLHVMADLIQSIGVMIAGAIIWAKPNWLLVDLLCTLVFSTFALFPTVPMLRKVFGILMERTPADISVDKLESSIKQIKGVQDVHDLHIWSITVGKSILSCHVVAEPGVSPGVLLCQIRDYCEKAYNFNHITIQIE